MNAIQVDQRIKAPIEPIHAVVEKRSFLMAVYVGDAILRLYWVGHGADDKTPVTEFTVSEKLENPPWYAPDGKVYAFGDPKNILGKYFIKFASASYSGFGAHGTPQPETVGTMASAGCIRMYDKDIEELFRLLPRRAKVEVRDSH
jgi:lipoprotein-anchoring transpeptidase ErfK/SrfK